MEQQLNAGASTPTLKALGIPEMKIPQLIRLSSFDELEKFGYGKLAVASLHQGAMNGSRLTNIGFDPSTQLLKFTSTKGASVTLPIPLAPGMRLFLVGDSHLIIDGSKDAAGQLISERLPAIADKDVAMVIDVSSAQGVDSSVPFSHLGKEGYSRFSSSAKLSDLVQYRFRCYLSDLGHVQPQALSQLYGFTVVPSANADSTATLLKKADGSLELGRDWYPGARIVPNLTATPTITETNWHGGSSAYSVHMIPDRNQFAARPI